MTRAAVLNRIGKLTFLEIIGEAQCLLPNFRAKAAAIDSNAIPKGLTKVFFDSANKYSSLSPE